VNGVNVVGVVILSGSYKASENDTAIAPPHHLAEFLINTQFVTDMLPGEARIPSIVTVLSSNLPGDLPPLRRNEH
jgi:hypothetical protein